MDPRAEDEPQEAASEVAITVVRTGGVAGLRRRWHVEPADEDAARWIALIDSCPWGSVPTTAPGAADRFVWAIDARCGDDRRAATLSEAGATGPWRDLIDEVRAPHRDPGP